MALLRLFDPTTQFQTKSGALNVAGRLRVFIENTDDLANIYGDDGSRLPQPLILDSNGRARGLFVNSGLSYRLEAYDRNDSLLFTIRRLEPNASGTIINPSLFIKGTPDEIDVEDSVTEKNRTYTVSLSAKVTGKIAENQEAIVKESEARKDADDDKVDKVYTATENHIAVFDNAGNIKDSGKTYADMQGEFKRKQTAKSSPTASGNALSFIDTVSQDAEGVITATKKSVTVDSTYSSSGTNPVNGKAVKAAIDGLDAAITSNDGTNVQVKVTETDGKISAVNITSDNTENRNNKVTAWSETTTDAHYPSEKLVKSSLDGKASSTHTHGNITNDGKIGSTANLVVVTGTSGVVTTADLTTASPTVPTSGTTTSLEFIDTVAQDSKGKLSATKKAVPVDSTYSSTGTNPVNGTAVAAAIGGLDVSSVGGNGKYISAISETDGKISAAATTMDTTPTTNSTKAVTSGGIKTALNNYVTRIKTGSSNFHVKNNEYYSFICRTNISNWERMQADFFCPNSDSSTVGKFNIFATLSTTDTSLHTPERVAKYGGIVWDYNYKGYNAIKYRIYVAKSGDNFYFYAKRNSLNDVALTAFRSCLLYTTNPDLTDNVSADLDDATWQTLSLVEMKNVYSSTTQERLDSHTSDTTVHITAEERKAWNAKQSALDFDTTPTAGSTNPVTSGGIKTAIDTVDAKGIVINEINGENVICFE